MAHEEKRKKRIALGKRPEGSKTNPPRSSKKPLPPELTVRPRTKQCTPLKGGRGSRGQTQRARNEIEEASESDEEAKCHIHPPYTFAV